ncbi:MAG TPA: signal recognition particle protein [Candidatus Limnocylindria bacterium]|nr:signal recognition particle protein [Candidatus Limnocylindria bacterium]
MFDRLSTRLQDIATRLRGQAKLTEADLDAALREVRLALLEADVNFRVVKSFVAHVRERALGTAVLDGVRPGHQVVKLVHDELVEILGHERYALRLDAADPTVILMVGLQGSGKTTSAAKLARRLARDGRHPQLVAADVYRPAAVEQLVRLGEQVGVPVRTASAGTAPLDIVTGALREAGTRDTDVVIVDTAGRQHVDGPMMSELEEIASATKPSEILLVVDAMTGQEAVRVAETFLERLPLTALVLTKLDGDARGGAALSIRSVTGLPVAYVGTGEAVDALEVFHPDRMAQRILGMGDIVTLVERAEERIDRDEAERAAQRLMEARFTLEDFKAQLQQVKKMGPIGQVLQMVPGASNLAGAAQDAVEDGELKRVEAIIDSMTPAERRDPHVIKASRRRRIAAGSGTTVADVNRLLRQFEEMQKLVRQLSGATGRTGGRHGSLPPLPRR